MTQIGEGLASRRRLLAAVLSCAGVVLTVVATFLPLMVGDATDRGETERIYFTSWGYPGDEDADISSPRFGYPMVFAAVVLLAATLTLLVSALPSVRLGSGRAGASISLAGSAMLVGITWGLALHVRYFIEAFEAANDRSGDVRFEVGFGAGFWLLVGGLVAAVAATVLAKLPTRPAPAAQLYPSILEEPTRPLAPHAPLVRTAPGGFAQ